MSDREDERRGEERGDAARDRSEQARRRADLARVEADEASNPVSAEAHRREAAIHDQAARLQDKAELMQRAHAEEARRGGPVAAARRKGEEADTAGADAVDEDTG